MKQYLDLMRHMRDHGTFKSDRTGTGTYSVFGYQMRFDLGAGFPLPALRGVPLLARTAGLIAHLYEELQQPAGFALSYQATRELQYDGKVPDGFGNTDR